MYTYKTVTNNRQDILIKDKRRRMATRVDIAVPRNNNLVNTVHHGIEKYGKLRMECERQWKFPSRILPIVVSTTGVMPHRTAETIKERGGLARELRVIQDTSGYNCKQMSVNLTVNECTLLRLG